MFDAETGMLVAVTNWGRGNVTDALHSSSWETALVKVLNK